MTELSIVCFRWAPSKDYRSCFPPEAVNILRRMVERHYRKPHRFWCITDDPSGLDDEVNIIPLWPDLGDLVNPSGPRNPSCFRRLKIFSRDMRERIGERIVMLDLDTVITGALEPLWERPEEFVAWGDTRHNHQYNGSMILFTAGARAELWEDFVPDKSPMQAKNAGYFGSDQGWISYRLGDGEARWTTADGVYSFRNHVAGKDLPDDSKVVFFHGHHDPWDADMQHLDWIRRHYRREAPCTA